MSYYKVEDVKSFLKELFDKNIIEAAVLPFKTFTEKTYHPFLIKDSSLLDKTEPLIDEMPVNTAREISKLTLKGALPYKTAVILKPCELKAFRELIKINQINPENIITISFDCNGVKSKDGEKREICNMCKNFTPEFADIKILKFGTENTVIETDIELGFEEVDIDENKRSKAIEDIIAKNLKYRDEKLKDIKANFKDLLKNCIVCHNCMRVCPICFCQECFFDSPALKNDSITYLMRSNRKSGLDFPENKLLFHLGRMNHMSVSCVNCGVCEDSCPADIPVGQMFAAAGDELKKLFNYEPGRDLEEKIPFTCYQHDELHDFEKEYK